MNRRTGSVALLLFGSGFCALIYQIGWLREFRLVFGASTAASAAVIAIFIGGLGFGGIVFGRRADRHPQPLLLYAQLETFIALSAALSPLLLLLVRHLYVGLGGTVVLGPALGTLIRLVLAMTVLSVPTLLMGGTLPAAARAVETEADPQRRGVALLYGVNTLGAVAGCLAATFFMLEIFGTRSTLWVAACVNVLIAVLARNLARVIGSGKEATPATPGPSSGAAPRGLVLLAAATVGFAFFLMELVWYRMLGPLLGGTVFSFGLILAVALLGIGLGGAFYSLFMANRPATRLRFAQTCLLEALLLAFPLALGDRVAILALLLRPLGYVGLSGFAAGWAIVTGLVVLPAAFIAGVQFPLLIALLGRGQDRVGYQVGLVYASNTAGAILGSLAGGFGLLPLLSAPGCWRLVVLLLLTLSIGTAAGFARNDRRPLRLLIHVAGGLLALGFLLAPGPSAVWRHSQIGAGRVHPETAQSPVKMRDWTNYRRRSTIWEAEGIESSVALDSTGGLAFVLNGRTDGNALADSGTQVMGGLLGAILRPDPKRSMVIGLGTGSTAGWLAAVPGMGAVDVVELEPAILHVAEACAPVNRQAMKNPRVHVRIGDAREVLLTTPARYDIIFSEPSNPFRAGVASLFTLEYYRAAAAHLTEKGLFIQWVQGYEVDAQTIRTIYATLASVFPHVETWQLQRGDLALVTSKTPIVYDAAALRDRVGQEPYCSALAATWRVGDLEGFLSHHLARGSLARAVAGAEGGDWNTDDQNQVEFGFARGAGRDNRFDVDDLRKTARLRHESNPDVRGGSVDWPRVEEERIALDSIAGVSLPLTPDLTPDQQHRIRAQRDSLSGNCSKALEEWRSQPREPSGPREIAILAQCLAEASDDAAVRYVEALRVFQPAEADAILARLRLRQARLPEAAAALEAAFLRHRQDPWPSASVMKEAFVSAEQIADADKTLAPRLFESLRQPFCVLALQEDRARACVALAFRLERRTVCLEALQPLEPHVPWTLALLSWRRSCYEELNHPNAKRAASELDDFLNQSPVSFGKGLGRTGP